MEICCEINLCVDKVSIFRDNISNRLKALEGDFILRVIAGIYKGRKLASPEGLDTRPTGDKVKEALFSIIQFELEGARFLDLFAGSGQMGIEALSRGADRACFVDNGKKANECIRANIKALSLSDKAEIRQTDAESFARTCSEKFDIIFLDPPYKEGYIEKLFFDVTNLANDSAAIICEVPKGLELYENINGFSLKKRYRYGKTELVLYRKNDSETEIY